MISRRAFSCSLSSLGLLASISPEAFAAPASFDWHMLAMEVRAEMAWAWRNYVELAFGHDQIKPVSGGAEEFLLSNGQGLGLSIVEALDTLYVMGLDAELEECFDRAHVLRTGLRADVPGDAEFPDLHGIYLFEQDEPMVVRVLLEFVQEDRVLLQRVESRVRFDLDEE